MMRKLGRAWMLGLFAMVGVLLVAQNANAASALINESTVSGGASSQEAQIAGNLGYTVTVVSDAVWGAMTAADFGAYDLLIVGDPTCGALPPGLVATAPVYGPVVLGAAGGRTIPGNRVLVGTDPVFHDGGVFTGPDARGTIIREGITFAGANAGATGMYFCSTCAANYSGQSVETLAIINAISAGSGTWTIDAFPPCGGAVSLIAANPNFTDLTTDSLQGWGCSVHEAYPTYTDDWSALAVATDTTDHPTCGVDPHTGLSACGEAYLLISGTDIHVDSLLISLTPPDASNPVGTSHTVTANVHAEGGSPVVPDQLVEFSVTGINGGAVGTCVPADCKTDAEGNVTFTYTDANGAGDDTIKASFTHSGSREETTAQKHWVEGCVPVTEICDNGIDDDCDGLVDSDDPDCEILYVDLGGFTVTPSDGRVTIDWNTLSEIDNAGFYLVRKDVLRGTSTRVNPGLIPANGDIYSGAAYHYVDNTALNGVQYTYALVDVSRMAKETRHPAARAIANPMNPRIRLNSPAYGMKMSPTAKTTFSWTPVTGFAATLKVSGDPSFPAASTISIGINGREKSTGRLTLAPREERAVRAMAARNPGVVYWKIVEQSVRSASDHSATLNFGYDVRPTNGPQGTRTRVSH